MDRCGGHPPTHTHTQRIFPSLIICKFALWLWCSLVRKTGSSRSPTPAGNGVQAGDGLFSPTSTAPLLSSGDLRVPPFS